MQKRNQGVRWAVHRGDDKGIHTLRLRGDDSKSSGFFIKSW